MKMLDEIVATSSNEEKKIKLLVQFHQLFLSYLE
jgi:hypothetical protein